VFTGRRNSSEDDGLWVMDLPRGEPRRILRWSGGCGSPTWLPDGRIAFTGMPGERVDGGDVETALHVVEADGTGAHRITFFADGDDLDPTVLPDGRILFAHRNGDEESTSLLTVHVDGTGINGYHGCNGPPAVRRHPRPGPGRATFCIEKGTKASVSRIDARRPFRSAVRMASDEAGTPGFVEPLDRETRAVARGPVEGRETWAILVEGRKASTLFDDPERDEIEVVAASPRPRPQGHLSLVKPEGSSGLLLGIDALRGRDAASEAGLHGGTHVRVVVAGESPVDIELERDGSFFARVPANRPLDVRVLDSLGRPLSRSGMRLWVRPNETRACLGCHENPAETPPNRLPLSVAEGPVDLVTPREEVGER
jgi:hypothetical protein